MTGLSLKTGLIIFVVVVVLLFLVVNMRSSKKKIVVDDSSDDESDYDDMDDPQDTNVFDVHREVDMFMEQQKKYLSSKD